MVVAGVVSAGVVSAGVLSGSVGPSVTAVETLSGSLTSADSVASRRAALTSTGSVGTSGVPLRRRRSPVARAAPAAKAPRAGGMGLDVARAGAEAADAASLVVALFVAAFFVAAFLVVELFVA